MSKHVLILGWEFPPFISGGLGVACAGIVYGLLEKDVTVTLVLPRVASDTPDAEGLQKITLPRTTDDFYKALLRGYKRKKMAIKSVDSLLTPYASAQTYLSRKEVTIAKRYGADLLAEVRRYAQQIVPIAASAEYDLIHAHDWLTILAGIEAQKMHRKPLIFHVHALEVDRSGENLNSTIYDIERYGLEQADMVIAVSHYTKNVIVKRYHIDPQKVRVLHNGLFRFELDQLQLTREESVKTNTVLFLGRVTYQKGPFYFIEAAYKIIRQRQDIQFVIAGEGDLLPSMIEQVAALGIGHYVHFTGFLERESVKKIYKQSKVYVMPSVSEPFGISCLEALAHHVPVIISKQSGVAEVLPEATTVDFWDTDQLAIKIMALIDQPALSDVLFKHLAKELSELSWDHVATALLAFYEQLGG